jgi:hypothetical protein
MFIHPPVNQPNSRIIICTLMNIGIVDFYQNQTAKSNFN